MHFHKNALYQQIIKPYNIEMATNMWIVILQITAYKSHSSSLRHNPTATDSGRTAHTPLYQSVLAVPPYFLPPFFSSPGQRNRRRPVPVPVTGMRYNSLLWMSTLNTLTWPVYDTAHVYATRTRMISWMYDAGLSNCAIVQHLWCHRSTISRISTCLQQTGTTWDRP